MTIVLTLLTLSILTGLLIVGAVCWHAGYQTGRIDAAAERHPANPTAVHHVTRRRRVFDQDLIPVGGRRG